LVRTHLFNKIGADHIYSTMEEALHQIHPALHSAEESKSCPLGAYPKPEIIHP
jgi:hypothetical protein